jgi:hypothetical protein
MFVLGLIAAFAVVMAFGAANARAAAPVANDVFAGTNDVTPVTVNFSATDDDLDPITYSIVDPPSGGTLGAVNNTPPGSVVYTANADFAGIDSFTYLATANGEDSEVAIATITVRPNTSAGGASGLTNDNTPEFTFTSPQTGMIFECRIDAGTYSACTSPFTSPVLADGAHTFQVRARAGAGGPFDTTPASRSVTVDATAPVPNLSQKNTQDDPTNQAPIDFELVSNEDLNASTVDASDFDVTNGSIDSVTGSGTQFDIVVTPAGDGDVTVDPSGTYEVADLAGNTTDFAGNADRTVTYDTTGPELSLEQANGQADPTNNDMIEFTLGSNEALDFASVDSSDFDITNGTFDSKVADGNDITIVVQASGQGSVDIAPSGTFEVADIPGNTSTTAAGADRSVVYDSVLPTVTLDQAAGQPDHTTSPDIEFTLAADEDLSASTVEASDFDVTNGSVASVTGSGDEYTIAVTAAAEGVVTIAPSGTFSVSDPAGNAQTNVTSTDDSVLYDTPAEVTLAQAAGQVDPTNVSPVEFELIGDENLNPATVEASDFDITNGSVTNIIGTLDTYTIEVTPAADGTVSIAPSGTFSVEDSVGNATTTAGGTDRSVVYDTTNPVVTIDSAPADPSPDRTPTFVFSSNEDPSDLECRLYVDGDTPPAFQACTSPYTSGDLAADEDYIFEARATDEAGNTGSAASWDWHISASTITGAAEVDPYYTRGGTPVSISIVANDTETGALEYSLADASDGGSVGTFSVDGNKGTAIYTAADGFAGIEALTIRVENLSTGGFIEVPVNVAVRPVTRLLTGPGVGAAPALINTNTPSFTFDAVSGPGDGPVTGATFTCTMDGDTIPTVECASGTYTPAAPLAEGEHTFTVAASKPALNTDPQPQSTTFTVDTIAPDAPVLDGTSGLVNSSTLNYTFTLPEGTAECRLNDGSDPAFAACASPVELLNVADGDYTYEVRTVDGAGNRSPISSRSVTVDTVLDITIDSAPADGNADAHPDFSFSSPEDPDVDYSCRIYPVDTPTVDTPSFEDCASPVTAPFLNRVTEYRFQVKGVDLAGNETIVTHDWDQANTAPVAPTPDYTFEAGTDQVVALGSTDADSDPLTYSIEGEVTGGTLGDIDQGTGDVTFSAAGDSAGDYQFDFGVTDDRENGSVTSTVTLHIQPNTVFVTTPPAETNDVTPTWTFDSPAESVANFECNLDGNGWEACDSGEYTAATDLPEGAHTLEVRAILGPLTDPTPASSTITVDTTAPDVTITDTPVALSNVAAPAFEFESTDPTATFECKVDDGDFAACQSGDQVAALTDGDHTFTVRPVDPGTNIGLEASYTWEVDLTKPVIEIQSGPAEGGWTNARKPIFEFTEADLNLVPESTVCSVDAQAPVADCLSPWQPAINLNDGLHTVTFESSDAAGNTQSVSVNFRVTTITPTVVIDEGPANPSGPTAAFKFSSTTDLGVDGKFQCRISLNGGSFGLWADCDDELTLTNLTSGSRTLQVRAVDSAGNSSTGGAIGTWTWNTVGGTPDTVITNQVTNGNTAAFGFNSPGFPLATFECRFDGGTWGACTSPKTYSSLSVGSHTFEVKATNQVGTVDPSAASHTWTVAAESAPNTTITRRVAANTTATEATFEFASSVSLGTFECRIDGGAWEACTSPKTYTGLAVGDHTFNVRAKTPSGLIDATPALANWTIGPEIIDPGEPPVCAPVTAFTSISKAVKIGKGLKIKVILSHKRAITDQVVTARVVVNGKNPKGKMAAKLKKALKGVDLVSEGAVVAAFTPGKWKTTFAAGPDTPSSLRVLVKRKKGAALRSSAPFTLVACTQG